MKQIIGTFLRISFAAYCIFGITNASGDTIQAATASRSAIPGAAYQSEKETFVGQECITGTVVQQGTQRSAFSFEQSLNEQQASALMGLSAGGRARFGAVEASASARFLKNSTSSKLSVSAIWISDYLLPNKKLTAPTLTAIGTAVRDHDKRWAETCGDQYVDEIVYGARLFFSIRVDFASEEQKQAFEAEFALSGPLYSANTKLEDASKRFSRDTKITITATQFGGDVSKITALFDSSERGQSSFTECTLGNFEGCAKVIGAALRYVTNTDSGFPSQLSESSKPGAAILEYRTAHYSAANIYPVNYPYLDDANKAARSRLHDAFEKYLTLTVVADRLLSIRLNEPMRAKILSERNKSDRNIAAILASSRVCYETPLKCVESVHSMQLTEIDQGVFSLPPFPHASYRLLTVEKGIWSRQESVTSMQSCEMGKRDASSIVALAICLPQLKNENPFRSVDIVSTVLYLEGIGLEKATFYFEGVDLGGVALRPSSSVPSEKRGPGFAAIVTSSNRTNPGWVDFDIESFVQKLMNKDHPDADGIFYIVVTDVFGRSARYDVEYVKWQSREFDSPKGKIRQLASWERVNRAWAPDSGEGLTLVRPEPALRSSSPSN